MAAAAGFTIDQLRNAGTRGKAVEEMLKGVRKLALDLYAQGKIHGVASLGGAEGAVLAASAMKVLPMGFPKLIVSPIASGHRKFGPLIGTRDTLVMHSIVDILGLNPISCAVYDNAAAAIAGMAKSFAQRGITTGRSRKAIAATMLGNTTKPLIHIRLDIEAHGYDFVIFHANGVGGPAMEELVTQHYFDAVLDYTLSEVAAHRGRLPRWWRRSSRRGSAIRRPASHRRGLSGFHRVRSQGRSAGKISRTSDLLPQP